MKITRILMMLAVCTLLMMGLSCNSSKPTTYQLTTFIGGQGILSPSSGTYEDGESVTIIAIPASGWELEEWWGAPTEITGSQNPIIITMDSDKEVWASFIPIPSMSLSQYNFVFVAEGASNPYSQTLTIHNSGGGQIDWQISDTSRWLYISPMRGHSEEGASIDVTLSIDTAGLDTGTYTATIYFYGHDWDYDLDIDMTTIPVTLIINPD